MEDTNKHKHDILRQQGAVLIPAAAYGDAAGLPMETRSAQYIAEHHGVISELLPTKLNPLFETSEDTGNWSDDTQLTLAVAKAIIKANGFDLATQAEMQLAVYNDESIPKIERKGKMIKQGWGGSTVDAMEKLNAGVDPTKSGTVGGAGNGVLIKMGPLAYLHGVRRPIVQTIYEQYDQFTNMTHDSPEARMTTKVHGDMLAYLLRDEYDKKQFMNVLEGSLAIHEFKETFGTRLDLGYLRNQLKYLYGTVNKETILSETDGRGFFAPQTLAMAYGAFIANDGEFTPSVYEAVNLGGDTDSIASIVAVMSAFKTKKPLRMPIDHQNLDRLPKLKSVSRQLAAVAFAN